MSDEELVRYEMPAPKVARLVLNRPRQRNAQNTALLYALNDAFDRAARDDAISVIILAAEGPHFSSGHDLREEDRMEAMSRFETVGTWCGFAQPGAEGLMAREEEVYLGFSDRWRNIPKPTIAEVHGKVISGGLMLIWPCDLIIAAEDAEFVDNVVEMGICGVEYFHHPWEFGARKAKELLFTSDALSAREAQQIGMVNQVVPTAELAERTLALAQRIAERPLFALKLAKRAVNGTQDAQGRAAGLQNAFALHQLAHSHAVQVYGQIFDPTFMSRLSGANGGA